MSTNIEEAPASIPTRQQKQKVWGWHLLFWAFFFIILGFNVPHGAEVFISVFGDSLGNWVIAYAFMVGIDVIIGYLTFARMALQYEHKDKGKQVIYMLVIVGICLGSCYLQILYNAHNFHPSLLSGAQDVPGFDFLPYSLSILPLLNIVMASMASLVGRPVVTVDEVKDGRSHEEKLRAIREKAELRKAQRDATFSLFHLPKGQKNNGTPYTDSSKSAVLHDGNSLPTPDVEIHQLSPVIAMQSGAEPVQEEPVTPPEFAVVVTPLPVVYASGADEQEEEETITRARIRIVNAKDNPLYSTQARIVHIYGDACYTLATAEKEWGLRPNALRPLFDSELAQTAPCFYAINTGKPYVNRHVRVEARETLVAYLKNTRPASILTATKSKQGSATRTKKDEKKEGQSMGEPVLITRQKKAINS